MAKRSNPKIGFAVQAREIVISTDAIQDLRTIRADTFARAHSRKVADDYLKRVRRHFRHLASTAHAYPRFYRSDGEATDCRLCVAEHHLAFFTADERQVCIVRVLHERCNWKAWLFRDGE